MVINCISSKYTQKIINSLFEIIGKHLRGYMPTTPSKAKGPLIEPYDSTDFDPQDGFAVSGMNSSKEPAAKLNARKANRIIDDRETIQTGEYSLPLAQDGVPKNQTTVDLSKDREEGRNIRLKKFQPINIEDQTEDPSDTVSLMIVYEDVDKEPYKTIDFTCI